MVQHLSRLTLSHFRSHTRVALDLDARPVAIFGPNGAGKTNLIEAVSLFSPGRGLRRASAQDMVRRPESLGWKVTGLLRDGDSTHDLAFLSDHGAARQVSVDGKPAPQVHLARLVRVLWLIPAMDRLWIEAPEGRRRFLDRMTLSFFPDHADHSLTYEKAMRERNRLLRDEVRDGHWYAALENQMAQSGALLTANRRAALDRLAQAQDGAETQFPAATLSLLDGEAPLPEAAADLRAALADHRGRDMMAGRTLLGPHRADLAGVFAAKGVAAQDCSTGEQKALLISLILANARALAAETGTPPLLLLDEVAAHLDASRRAALYDEICALGAQAWMTGTGPELFMDLGARAQYLEVTEREGQSVVENRRL